MGYMPVQPLASCHPLVSHSFRVDRESSQLFSMLPVGAQRQRKEATWSKGQPSSNFQESMAQD